MPPPPASIRPSQRPSSPALGGAPLLAELDSPIELVRRRRGRVLVRGRDERAALEIDACDTPLLALLDGTRTVAALVDAAARLPDPLDARRVLDVLRELAGASLLRVPDAGPVPSAAASSPGAVIRSARRRRWLALRVGVPGTGWIFAPGAALGIRGAWVVGALVLATLVGALLAAVELRRGPLLLDPFFHATEPGRALIAFWAYAAIALSARGLARGIALRAMGIPCPRVTLALTALVPHLDADAGGRRGAHAWQRAGLAASGLVGIAATSACAIVLGLWVDPLRYLPMAATSLLVLVADLCPYLPTDAWELVAIGARVPALARRSAAWLVRASFRNWVAGRSSTPVERRLALVASLWGAHAIVTEVWIARGTFPSALRLARRAIVRLGPGDVLGLIGALLLVSVLVAAVLGVGIVLAVAVARTVFASLARGRAAAGDARGPARARGREQLALDFARIPALSVLEGAALEATMDAASHVRFPAGSVLRAQGEPESRLVLLLAGAARSAIVDESGLARSTRDLGPGAALGASALVAPVRARSTVRATTAVEALVLDADAFRAALGRPGGCRARTLVAALAGLGRDPRLSALAAEDAARVVASTEVRSASAGTEAELDPTDEAWLVVAGRGVSLSADARGPVEQAPFEAGDCLRRPRGTASARLRVRCETATVLARVDVERAFDALLGAADDAAIGRWLAIATRAEGEG